jgi:hypothetical protein
MQGSEILYGYRPLETMPIQFTFCGQGKTATSSVLEYGMQNSTSSAIHLEAFE